MELGAAFIDYGTMIQAHFGESHTLPTPLYDTPARDKYGDRFIPNRSGSNWAVNYSLIQEKSPGQLQPKKAAKEAATSDTSKDGVAYASLLKNELLNTSIEDIKEQSEDRRPLEGRNLFKYQRPDPVDHYSPYSLSPVSLKSQALLRSPRKASRKISRIPFKVLDAPELQDDFYLNLVDWSAGNVLSVGLGTCVYLWSACTSQVTRLCDLSADGDSVTSVAWAERGHQVAVGTHKGLVQVWDVAATKRTALLEGHTARVGALAWNCDLLSSGSRDRAILQRDVRTPAQVPERRLNGHRQEDTSLVSLVLAEQPLVMKLPLMSPASCELRSGIVRRWVREFKNGRTDDHDEPRAGRPSVSDETIAKVEAAMLEDRRYSKVCAIWVPKILTEDHKRQQVDATQKFLDCHKTDGEEFLDSINKRRETLTKGVRFHHDNARPHTAHQTTALIEEFEWELVSHPPYSPDVATSDFHLFPELKKNLGGTQFQDDDELEEAVLGFYAARRQSSLTMGSITPFLRNGPCRIRPPVLTYKYSHLTVSSPQRKPTSVVTKVLLIHHVVCGLKWSPDNQHLASGGNDNRLFVWSLSGGASPVQTYTEHLAAVKAIAWSPHHHGLLASGGGTADRCIRFWNTLTGQAMQCVDTGSQVCNLAWSKHASELVSTHGYSQNQILVWKYPALVQVAKLTGHSYRVLYLAMSPDGESIVTGAGDETLRFWNVFSKARSQKETKSALNLFTSIR
ncbi:FZR1 [Cordylochernes scorpioides]|uniref:FZR1 n=1 Tax=Cordylochernes scorpioides TaxID=51811 RepID=A0ABY6K8L8_9ARAC|nr:FZR1 [Cordylochernes scorpioides]